MADFVKGTGVASVIVAIVIAGLIIAFFVNFSMTFSKNKEYLRYLKEVIVVGKYSTTVHVPQNRSFVFGTLFQSCSDLASITILSRDVEIDDSSYTLPTTATIYGYAGSTAQAYAEKYDRTFVILDEPIEPTESTEPTDTTEPGSEGGGSAVVWIIVAVVVVLAGIFIAVCVYQKKKK